MTLFGVREIVTDLAHARRVAAGLERLGPMVRDRLTTGFLCTDPGKDLKLLRFARLCFDVGPPGRPDAGPRRCGRCLRHRAGRQL